MNKEDATQIHDRQSALLYNLAELVHKLAENIESITYRVIALENKVDSREYF